MTKYLVISVQTEYCKVGSEFNGPVPVPNSAWKITQAQTLEGAWLVAYATAAIARRAAFIFDTATLGSKTALEAEDFSKADGCFPSNMYSASDRPQDEVVIKSSEPQATEILNAHLSFAAQEEKKESIILSE